MLRLRPLAAFAAVAAVLLFAFADAEARVGGGFSGGSRGSRTFSAPPATSTAPNTAAPIQRSVTQPGAAGTSMPNSVPIGRPGFFGSGLFGGLAAGFLGAGLFGMLFGSGFFGGMGGGASLLGLLLQIALVVIVARLALRWWQHRSTPAFAGPTVGMRHPYEDARTGFGANAPSDAPLSVEKSDFDQFEQLLGDIQAAYSAEDVGKLRALVTPEMLSYFSEDLSANASRGEVNRIENVKLLQGDLAEAWREGSTDYATVDMRFSLDDRMLERDTGRVLSGGPDEATEVWTFMRVPGGRWVLSAIQQA